MSYVCKDLGFIEKNYSENYSCGFNGNFPPPEGLDSMSVMSMVLCTAGATVILVILSCLLVHSERFESIF